MEGAKVKFLLYNKSGFRLVTKYSNIRLIREELWEAVSHF